MIVVARYLLLLFIVRAMIRYSRGRHILFPLRSAVQYVLSSGHFFFSSYFFFGMELKDTAATRVYRVYYSSVVVQAELYRS